MFCNIDRSKDDLQMHAGISQEKYKTLKIRRPKTKKKKKTLKRQVYQTQPKDEQTATNALNKSFKI